MYFDILGLKSVDPIANYACFRCPQRYASTFNLVCQCTLFYRKFYILQVWPLCRLGPWLTREKI